MERHGDRHDEIGVRRYRGNLCGIVRDTRQNDFGDRDAALLRRHTTYDQAQRGKQDALLHQTAGLQTLQAGIFIR